MVTEEEVDAEAKTVVDDCKPAHQALKASFGKPDEEEASAPAEVPAEIVTAVPADNSGRSTSS